MRPCRLREAMSPAMFAGLDHIAIAAHDLAALAGAYERLGFCLTPLSCHAGRAGPDGVPMAGGTGNRCAMLPQGYLELLGVLDPAADTRDVPSLIARHDGLHIVAFASDDPDADMRRLADAGFESALLELNRDVVLDGRAEVARFTQVRVPGVAMSEARIFGLRHETPDLVWLSDHLDHPNGAVALADVIVAVPDLRAAVTRYTRFAGVEPDIDGDVARFAMNAGTLILAAPDAAARVAPGIALHPEGQALAFTVTVRDLDHTAALLGANAIPFDAADGRLLVDPHYAGNAGCAFRQHP